MFLESRLTYCIWNLGYKIEITITMSTVLEMPTAVPTKELPLLFLVSGADTFASVLQRVSQPTVSSEDVSE